MALIVEDVSSVIKRLKIDVDSERVSGEIKKVTRDLSQQVRIPGFRPGKAPYGMLQKRYWPEISHRVQDKLIEEMVLAAIKDKDLPMVGTSAINPGTLEDGQPFSFSADIEVRPTVEAKDYEGLKVRRPRVEVSEEEVTEQLENIRKAHKNFIPVADRAVTQNGDLLSMDFVLQDGGQVIAKQENAMISLGEGRFLPEGEKLLIGLTVPGTLDQPVVYPADFPIREVAGKTIKVTVQAKEIKKEELPEVDDALAQEAGEDNLAALRASIVKRLTEQKEKESRHLLEENVNDALIAAHQFEVPPTMIRQRARYMVASTLERLSYMSPQFRNVDPQVVDQLAEGNRPQAEREVRASLIMAAIAKKESIAVTKEELDAEITKIAQGAGQTVEKVRAEFQKEDALMGLELMISKRKTMDLLIAKAAIEEVDAALLKAEREKKDEELSKLAMPAPVEAAPAAQSEGAST